MFLSQIHTYKQKSKLFTTVLLTEIKEIRKQKARENKNKKMIICKRGVANRKQNQDFFFKVL